MPTLPGTIGSNGTFLPVARVVEFAASSVADEGDDVEDAERQQHQRDDDARQVIARAVALDQQVRRRRGSRPARSCARRRCRPAASRRSARRRARGRRARPSAAVSSETRVAIVSRASRISTVRSMSPSSSSAACRRAAGKRTTNVQRAGGCGALASRLDAPALGGAGACTRPRDADHLAAAARRSRRARRPRSGSGPCGRPIWTSLGLDDVDRQRLVRRQRHRVAAAIDDRQRRARRRARPAPSAARRSRRSASPSRAWRSSRGSRRRKAARRSGSAAPRTRPPRRARAGSGFSRRWTNRRSPVPEDAEQLAEHPRALGVELERALAVGRAGDAHVAVLEVSRRPCRVAEQRRAPRPARAARPTTARSAGRAGRGTPGRTRAARAGQRERADGACAAAGCARIRRRRPRGCPRGGLALGRIGHVLAREQRRQPSTELALARRLSAMCGGMSRAPPLASVGLAIAALSRSRGAGCRAEGQDPGRGVQAASRPRSTRATAARCSTRSIRRRAGTGCRSRSSTARRTTSCSATIRRAEIRERETRRFEPPPTAPSARELFTCDAAPASCRCCARWCCRARRSRTGPGDGPAAAVLASGARVELARGQERRLGLRRAGQARRGRQEPRLPRSGGGPRQRRRLRARRRARRANEPQAGRAADGAGRSCRC